jgi:glycosyltransferase involved in cell wall biosynthesis
VQVNSPAPGNAPIAISVLICTRDRPRELARCLEAVFAQRYSMFEVIVVDNAPSDGATENLCSQLPVLYVREMRPGLSNARNQGIRSATHDVIAFTDDDTVPDPCWLEALAIAFMDPDVLAVTGRVTPGALETPAQVIFECACGGMSKGTEARTFSRDHLSEQQRIATQRMGVGANMAFRSQVFAKCGGFDPWLGAGAPGRAAEDLDMFHRVVEAGLTLRYEPDASVRHYHRRGIRDLQRQLEDAAAGYSAYIRKLAHSSSLRRTSVVRSEILWYGWLASRIALRAFGLKRVPSRFLVAQLRAAIQARRTGYAPPG